MSYWNKPHKNPQGVLQNCSRTRLSRFLMKRRLMMIQEKRKSLSRGTNVAMMDCSWLLFRFWPCLLPLKSENVFKNSKVSCHQQPKITDLFDKKTPVGYWPFFSSKILRFQMSQLTRSSIPGGFFFIEHFISPVSTEIGDFLKSFQLFPSDRNKTMMNDFGKNLAPFTSYHSPKNVKKNFLQLPTQNSHLTSS